MRIDDLYTNVTNRIIEELESGAYPWVKPWKAGEAVMPQNAVTGRPYNGINVLILWMTAQAALYPENRWLTFHQALDKGGHVRKGERGTQVVLVKKISVGEEEADDRKQVSMLKTFTVFNVAQVEGLTTSPAIAERITPVSEFVAATKAEIRHGHPQAFYSPGHDAICLPNPETFEEPCHYDATLLHELTHWTGHKSRLDRQLGGRFGSEAYAAEELVAELGAAFLCPHLGVKGMLRHAGYIEDWLRLLKGDNRAIFTASAKAAQAVDYLRSFSEQKEDIAA